MERLDIAAILTEHAALSLSSADDRAVLTKAIEVGVVAALERLGYAHPDHHSGSAIIEVAGDLLGEDDA